MRAPPKMPARGRSPYLTLEEAAEIARAPIGTLRRWIADGRLRHVRPGRRVLIRETDLLAFIEGSAAAPQLRALPGRVRP